MENPGQFRVEINTYDAACYACHQSRGAVDITFTQFYPTAKTIAQKSGTYQDR
jgi:hypothetical protein